MREETSVFEQEKLYYQDAYDKQCDAVVLACEEEKKGYCIRLNQSVFFPEGGGQPYDQGTLTLSSGEVINVLEVHEKEYIRIICDKPVPVGETVNCKLDWQRRFDHMQQHSGEHIFSGFVHRKFGCQNVGFHISEGIVTVDFDKVISLEEMKEIERQTNAYIWENHPCNIIYPKKEELTNLEYRSKMEIAGQIRLVEFPGADVCACCGTHVAYSGEVGVLKVLSCINWRGGIRVELVCGRYAFEYLNRIQEQNSAISVRLSAKVFETANAVERIQNEAGMLRLKLSNFELKALKERAQQFNGCEEVLCFEEELSSDSVRKLCDLVMNQTDGICRIFSGNDTDGYKYAMGQANGDLKELTKQMNAALNGRGGGKPSFVQGSVNATRKEIEDFFQTVKC